MENKNYFEELNAVNCNDKTEKKNGLTYLSWAYAWGELKKRYPESGYRIYESGNGCLYHTDGKTAWVKVGVEVLGIEHIEYLPVMDNRNKSIPIESITSTDANKAVQRALTKAIARHGLGLYIYAGEDLPDASITDAEVRERIESAKTYEQLKATYREIVALGYADTTKLTTWCARQRTEIEANIAEAKAKASGYDNPELEAVNG